MACNDMELMEALATNTTVVNGTLQCTHRTLEKLHIEQTIPIPTNFILPEIHSCPISYEYLIVGVYTMQRNG